MAGNDKKKEFLEEGEARRSGLLSEFSFFLMHNKKWWLLPIIVLMGLVGALVLLSGSAAAPFIYTLF